VEVAVTFFNEGGLDRAIRLLLGAGLLFAGWYYFTGALAVGALIVGLIAAVTGLVGWCPLYSVMHCSTRRVRT
jgi:hypothetical protein